MTRCNRSNGTCATVAVQFLNNPEQTVCEIPGMAEASTSGGGGSSTRKVGLGKKFTFAIPGGGGGCGGCPKPVRVTVRVYHQDGHRGRVQLGSGELDVTPSAQRPAADHHDDDDDEQTVVITKPRDDGGCGGGRCGAGSGRSERDTVAVLAVRARAWCAGPVTAVPLEPASGRELNQCRNKSTTTTAPPPPCGPQRMLDDGCCGTAAATKARRPPPPAARTTTAAGRQCPDCTVASITTDASTDTAADTNADATADTTAADEHRDNERQYTSMDCEINGRKIDLHARYRDRETHEAEKQLVFEAEAFASMVYTLVSEMHGLILKATPPAPDIDGQ